MTESYESKVLARLDLMVGVMQLAYDEQISAARQRLRADPVVKAILEASEDWVAGGALVSSVMQETSAAKRTVQRRVAELIDRRALAARGASHSISYRTTGLI